MRTSKLFSYEYLKQKNLYSDNVINLIDDNNFINIVGNIRFQRMFHFEKYHIEETGNTDVFPHSHASYEIHFLSKGSLPLSIGDRNIRLEPNDILIIAPQVFHTYNESNESISISSAPLYITPEPRKTNFDFYTAFISAIQDNGGWYLIKNCTRVMDYMDLISSYIDMETPLFMEFSNHLSALIFTEIVQQVCPISSDTPSNADNVSKKHLQIQTIETFINYNYSKNISLDDLSEFLSISKSTLNRLFSKYFNVNFRTYLSNIRLENAKFRIVTTDLSLEEIAHSVGYSSYPGFYIAFQKKYGISPQQYRDEHK